MVTDHLWLNVTKGFKALGTLYPGDVVAFDARVTSYLKGYEGEGEPQELDYRLSRPTNVKLWRRGDTGSPDYYLVCPECGYHNRQGEENCRRCRELLVQISGQEECVPEYTPSSRTLYQQQTLFPEAEEEK